MDVLFMSYKKNRLILQESCLVLQPMLVKDIGRSAALVLQQMHYWISSEKYGKAIEGQRWIYNSYEAWAEQIKIYSISTIRRAIAKLETLGLLKSNILSPKKSDRTKWYTINYTKLNCSQNVKEGRGDQKEHEEKEVKVISTRKTGEIKMNTSSAQNESLYIRKTETTSKTKQSSTLLDTSKTFDEISLSLLNIWKKNVGGEGELRFNPKRKSFLLAAFQQRFGKSMESFEAYCNTIASSDFLMGKIKSSFKASLDWALRFDIIDRILEGDFGVKKPLIVQVIVQQQDGSGDQTVSNPNIDSAFHEPESIKMLRKNIRKKIGEGSYISWFHKPIHQTDQGFRLLGQGAFWKNYVDTHFKDVLCELSLVTDVETQV